MASVKVISAFNWGADNLVIADGDGLGAIPEVVSAVATSRNQVTVTFDREMSFHLTESKILDPDSYYVEDVLFFRQLFVVRVEQISDTEVRLITQDHEAIDYQLTVRDVQDKFGNYIGGVNNTATFTGIEPSTEFPVATKTYSFWGLYAGMESSEETGITPDGDPPYLTNQDPAPGQLGVLRDKIITFEVNDDDLGVRLNLTKIFVEGSLAYDGTIDSFIAPYNGAGSGVSGDPSKYTFAIQKTADWDSYKLITVRVVSSDLSPIPNYLDETYGFTAEDYQAPVLTDAFPTGTDIPRGTNMSFTLRDVGGSGVDQNTINCTVSGEIAIQDGIFQFPYNGVGSSITPNAFNGYDVVIDPTVDFDTYENVVVNVAFDDNEGSSGAGGWTFKVEDYLGPLITPLYPVNGQEGVVRDVNIQVKLTDEQAISPGTLVEISINSDPYVTAWQEGVGFAPGFQGPQSQAVMGAGIITLTIDSETDFPFAADVLVRITAFDPDGNPERLS
jgi:hypothetical protein